MPKSINIGNMNAHLDTKTGFIRITSTEPGSNLKKNQFLLNVTPGSKEYSMLIDEIMTENSLSEMNHKPINSITLSDKYRSDSLGSVPIGVDINNKETVYWYAKRSAYGRNLLIEGETGSGKSIMIATIMDHLDRHREQVKVLWSTHSTEFSAFSEKSEEPLDYINYYDSGDSSVLVDAYNEMSKRESERLSGVDTLDRKAKEVKKLFVILDNAEEMFSGEENEKSKNLDMLEHLLLEGKRYGIYIVGAFQEVEGILSRKCILFFDVQVHTRTEKEGKDRLYRGDRAGNAADSTFVPFIVR